MRLVVYSRGDTIIEVLLAFTIFSMVAVGALGVMNRGVATSQNALEITLVRQQIDAQAEALRAAHQAYAADVTQTGSQWDVIKTKTGSYTYATTNPRCPTSVANVGSSFIMNPSTATVVTSGWFGDITSGTATPYARLVTTGAPVSYGMWIQAERDTRGGPPNAYNFRIRACWYSSGDNSRPIQLETLVRLYDPAT